MNDSLLVAYLIAAATVLGACVGSFLNVVVYRVPRGMSVISPRSACTSCGHVLTFADMVPVLSWLALRRRCRHCHAPVSGSYAVLEATTAVFAGATAAATLLLGTRDTVIVEACLVLVVLCVLGLPPLLRGRSRQVADDRDAEAVAARHQPDLHAIVETGAAQ